MQAFDLARDVARQQRQGNCRGDDQARDDGRLARQRSNVIIARFQRFSPLREIFQAHERSLGNGREGIGRHAGRQAGLFADLAIEPAQ